jgi:hypothetical protein
MSELGGEYLEALNGKSRVLGATHPATILTAARLSAMYQKTGRYPEAERQLLRIGSVTSGSFHAQGATVDVVKQLVGLYDAWGRADAAAECRAKLPKESAATRAR